jgi:hypothetical protein
MQFTSGSTLTNTLFISIVALLSMIPAANAAVTVTYSNPGIEPKGRGIFYGGDAIDVRWYVPKRGKTSGKS